MNRRWVYGSAALVLALLGAAIFAYLDSPQEVEPQIVDLTIPARGADDGIRSIPLDPAVKVTYDAEPAAPVDAEDQDFPELAGTELESQAPALERLPEPLVAAYNRRGRIVEEGVRFGQFWVLIGELFSEHAWVEIVNEHGAIIWQQTAKDSSRSYWQVLSTSLDLTQDGKPDLHLISSTGGMHCCIDHVVFETTRMRAPHEVYQGEGEVQQFRRLATGAPVLWVPDSAAYLWTSYANSATIWVPIRFDGHEFSPAPELISRPAQMSRARVSRMMQLMLDAHQAGEPILTDPLAMLMQALGDEVYAGRAASAQTLIAEVWPKGLPGEDDFRCAASDWFQNAGHAEVLEALNKMPIQQILQTPARCPSEKKNRWN